jgi:pyridoxamine 5'-phosphate oxidase
MSSFLGPRLTYGAGSLERESLPEDPFLLLNAWLDGGTSPGEPNAMALSTVGQSGRPSSRIVLVRAIDDGLTFFTNYDSRKGRELASNPWAAGLFWWSERQVRIEGPVAKVSSEESDAYFAGRPLESQLASAVSPQSQEIDNRESLVLAMESLRSRAPVERPTHWGGYRLVPERFEFWQGREARLHDRFVYERLEAGWRIARLAP